MKTRLCAICLSLAGCLPLQAEMLVGAWECTDVSLEPTFDDVAVVCNDDGTSNYGATVKMKNYGITFRAGFTTTGVWTFDGLTLENTVEVIDLTQLNVGGKNMLGTRTEDDLHVLMTRSLANDVDLSFREFDGPDKMVMTEGGTVMQCQRLNDIPLSKNRQHDTPTIRIAGHTSMSTQLQWSEI